MVVVCVVVVDISMYEIREKEKEESWLGSQYRCGSGTDLVLKHLCISTKKIRDVMPIPIPLMLFLFVNRSQHSNKYNIS